MGSAVVVGARGFIGRPLVSALEARGITTTPVGRGALAEPDIWGALAPARTIYWAASTINPAIAAAEPQRAAAEKDVLVSVLRHLDRSRSTARVVLFSSGGTVYGSGTPPFTEESSTEPTSAYGTAKLRLEAALREEYAHGTSVRISNAYGPGQWPAPGQGVLGHWLLAVAQERAIQVIGDLGTIRDYVYIDDLVEALLAVHTTPSPVPPVLNLASGSPTTLREVLEIVENVSEHHSPTIEFLPARSFDLSEVWLDASLAQRALGWHARTPLATGVRAMWDWILAEEMSRSRASLHR